MRLVNAEKVYKELEKCELTATLGNPLSEYECGYCAGIDRAERELEDAETVEAVPIAFIQERIESLQKLIERYKRDPSTEYAAVHYAGEMFVLEELIRIWKEDGRK